MNFDTGMRGAGNGASHDGGVHCLRDSHCACLDRAGNPVLPAYLFLLYFASIVIVLAITLMYKNQNPLMREKILILFMPDSSSGRLL